MLWYYADFGADRRPADAVGEGREARAATRRTRSTTTAGSRTVSGLRLHVGSKRTVKATADTSVCPGPHPGVLVRATATGAVRSNAVK